MSSTTVNITVSDSFLQDFEVFSDLYGKQTPEFNSLRKAAAEKFTALGIPTSRHEEWKYLNLSALSKTNFRTVSPADKLTLKAADAEQFRLTGEDSFLYVIENGKLNKEASNSNALPKGLTIGSITDLASDKRVQQHFAKHAEFSNEAFVALNTAMSFDAVVILVDDKIKIDQPIQLAFINSADRENITVPVRCIVIAGKQSEVTVSETYHTLSSVNKIFVNAVSEVVVAEDARVHYSKVQNESDNTTHISYHQVNQARNSYQHITTLSLGGSLTRNNLHIKLDDVNCTSYLNGLYVANDKQVIDNHSLVDHAMPNCYSNELYKGIIDGNAQGVFNGKIFVRKDAQKTNAYQSNKNILLSNDATMNAKPQLEIFADDVKCSHGATTGQLDDEALFYLRSRGIAETSARAMLNHAFAADVIEQVESEPLKESLLLLLSRKLSEMGS